MNALETYKKILDTLNYSDIVWSRYGTETIKELALKLTRITFPDFQIPE